MIGFHSAIPFMARDDIEPLFLFRAKAKDSATFFKINSFQIAFIGGKCDKVGDIWHCEPTHCKFAQR